MAIIIIGLTLFSADLRAQDESSLPPKWRKWLKEEVVYIISEREREIFLQLKTEEQRESFEEAFWLSRDPTPGTEANEYREEHQARLDYANKFLGRESVLPGWKTDRGKMYIILGKPKQIQSYPGAGEIYPLELWFYQADISKGLPPFFYLIFFKRYGSGEYVLYNPSLDGPSALLTTMHTADNRVARQRLFEINPELAHAAFSYLVDEGGGPADLRPSIGSIALIAKIENAKNVGVDATYAERILVGEETVFTEYVFRSQQLDSVVFAGLNESGRSVINYAFRMAPNQLSLGEYEDKIYGALEIDTRLANEEGLTILRKTKNLELDFTKAEFATAKYRPLIFEDQLLALPGNYNLSIQVRNKVSKEYFLISLDTEVPGTNSEVPTAGNLQISAGIEQLTRDDLRAARPFQFGSVKFLIRPSKTYDSTSPIYLFCQAFLPERIRREAGRKFSVTFTLRDQAGAELSSAAQTFDVVQANEQGTFQLATRFPVSQLGPARYSLALGFDFGAGEEQLVRSEDFEIRDSNLPPPLVYYGDRIDFDSAKADADLGALYAQEGDLDSAVDSFLSAINKDPVNTEYRISIASLLKKKEQYQQMVLVLQPPLASDPDNPDLLRLTAEGYYLQEEYGKAAKFFERLRIEEGDNIAVLNSLAECYRMTGEKEKAAGLWRLSLEKNPEQSDIREKLKEIDGKTPGSP